MIAVVLLAAGGSSRLGSPKQLLVHQGKTLLRRAAEEACGSTCKPVVVVIGREPGKMRAELEGLPLRIVEHAAWAEGIGSSLAAGLAGLEADAAIVMLCDQPRVTLRDLDILAAAYRVKKRSVVTATYAGVRGPPVLFAREHFDALRALEGDRGARRVIDRARDVEEIPMPYAAVDVDTEEDYRRLG
jgi:molybdenum cofactor cytidylyltransferase